MITVTKVTVYARKTVICNRKILRLKGKEDYFESVETAYGKDETFEGGKTILVDMQFITESDSDEDMEKSLLNNEDIKARIEIMGSKSAFFNILRVRPATVIFERVLGIIPPPLAIYEEDDEIISKLLNEGNQVK